MLRMFDNAAGSFDVDKKRNIKNPLAVPYWLQPLATGCLNCGYQRKPSAQAVYMYTSVHITYRCVWCAGINAIRAVRRASEWNKSVLIHCKTFAVSILLSSADIHAYERGIWCDVIGQYMTGNHSIRATSALRFQKPYSGVHTAITEWDELKQIAQLHLIVWLLAFVHAGNGATFLGFGRRLKPSKSVAYLSSETKCRAKVNDTLNFLWPLCVN